MSFGNPTRVNIAGYTGDAMEPFLSPDGNFLFFNSSNANPSLTTLYVAVKIDKNNFQSLGPLNGANLSGVLNACASVDSRGNLFFITTRSYGVDYNTVYAGSFDDGVFAGLYETSNDFPQKVPGVVVSDASVSADGQTIIYTRETTTGQIVSFLFIANKLGNTWVTDPNSDVILGNINASGQLDYSGDLSPDNLTLYFTRYNPATQTFEIMMAVRPSLLLPFGVPTTILSTGPSNVAEAPTISPDGTTLYYHQLTNGVYVINEMSH